MLKQISRLKPLLILSASLAFPNLYGESRQPVQTEEGPSPCIGTIRARHIEPRGVGYNHGYTTIEGLSFPAQDSTYIWPLIDVRGHRFDNNEYAANGGLGFRYYAPEPQVIFGFNSYIDYRTNHFHKFHFSQVGAGVEILNPYVDVRINGYLPLKKWERVRKCTFRNSSGKFFISRKKVKAALEGGDLEIGNALFHNDDIELYGAVGTYLYADHCQNLWGGRYRVHLSVYTHFFVDALITHDPVFGIRGQGQVGVNIPLGCSGKKSWMQRRLTQPVQRHEIIVLHKYCRWRTNL